MSHEVFISYSSKDKHAAEEVCLALEASGTLCWIAPRDVMPGRPYGAALIDAINASTVMVLLLSEHSNHSQQVVREVERATAKAVPIIPLRLQDIRLNKSLEYFLSTCHWLDATDGPTPAHLAALTEAVNATLRGVYENETVQFNGRIMAKAAPAENKQEEIILAERIHTEDATSHFRPPQHSRPAQQPSSRNQNPYQTPQHNLPTQRRRTHHNSSNVLGIVGLTTSLLSVFTCFALSPFGFLLSLIGLFKAPRGSAIGGSIFGAIGSTILAVMFSYGFYGGFMTAVQMEAATEQVEAYAADIGEYPDDFTGGELIADEKDGWNNPLRYQLRENGYEIRSAGLDGIFDNEDDQTTWR